MRYSITLLGLLLISLNSWAQITSAGNGTWSSTSTWVGGHVPTSSDDVVIATSHTVDVDINGAACNNLTVNGTLEYPATDGMALQVNGDLVVGNTGILLASAAFASGATQQGLTLLGNFTVNGTYTGSVTGGGDSRHIALSMYGDGKTILGTGTFLIPDLRIFANTTLDYPVGGCSNLALYGGNLDNSSFNITLPSGAALYRSSGTISAAPTWAGIADVYYSNSSPMTTGNELPSTVSVLGMQNAGGVTLNKPVTVTTEADLSGVLTTGAYSLTMGAGANLNSTETDFVKGTLVMTVTGTGSTYFDVGSNSTRARPLNLTLSALTFNSGSTGIITVKATEPNPPPSSNSSGASRISTVSYWTITPGPTIASFTANVSLYWTTAGDGVTNLGTMTVVKGTAGGAWTLANNAGGTSGSTTSGNVQGNGFTSFGDFALGSTAGGNNPLPVELTSFTASVSKLTTIIAWKTATEVNNDGFDVERKPLPNHPLTGEGIQGWGRVGFVEGNGTSSAPHNYSYTDNVGTAGTFSYRLKQIDHDGAFTYSQEAQVTIEAPKVFALSQNYPDPFNPSTTIQFTVPSDGRATLTVYNALGQEVATLFDGVAKAGEYHQTTFNAARLASGIYFSRLEFDGKMQMKKMLLLK
jgi:G8 domain/Secretion system C-terminal sorting domain